MDSEDPVQGHLVLPEPEIVVEPWVTRCHPQVWNPRVFNKSLVFELMMDLGFGVYHQQTFVLNDVEILNSELAVPFTEQWAINGTPNFLKAITIRMKGVSYVSWGVTLLRAELDPETYKIIEWSSLSRALVAQGLAKFQSATKH